MSGEFSMNKSPVKYGIPKRTLRQHVRQNKTTNYKLDLKPVFSRMEEKELVNRIKQSLSVEYPLTAKSVRFWKRMERKFPIQMNISWQVIICVTV